MGKIAVTLEILIILCSGSLFLLGKHHARNCANFVKKYGPVFQARLGNRVSEPLDHSPATPLNDN